jgi:zinc transport system substrate-binding protein
MLKAIIAATILITTSMTACAAPKVIASIVPLHSLVAGVMDGVAEPELLLKGVNSEHQGSYSPQQISDLGHADLVFIIGDNLEVKLGEISGTEAVNGKTFVKMLTLPNLITHPIRNGGVWDVDSDAMGMVDPHIWLDPENAIAMTKAIATTLAETDPANKATYDANAAKQAASLAALETEIKNILVRDKAKPFIVFHDAYQYFERRFGVTAVGSISDYTATPPSAQRLEEIRGKVHSSNAACVFREPQYSDAAVTAVIEGSTAKLSVLDAIGAKLTPGQTAYPELLRTIAKNLNDCLAN